MSLNIRRVVMRAMHLGGPKHQLGQRQMVNALEIGEVFHA